MEDVVLTCADGRRLAATYWSARRPSATVIIAGATGVPRTFYARAAAVLAKRHSAVLTFDYRGIAGSRDRRLRSDRARMQDWGRMDLEAALQWMASRHRGVPCVVVCHSVGGQIFALAASSKDVQAAVFVGCQSGWWRLWPWPRRGLLWLLWHLVIPVTTRLLGHFPAPWFGMGEPLPPLVARQWAFWARHRDYLVDEDGVPYPDHTRWSGRVLALVPTRDPLFGPLAAQEALLARYARATVERHPVAAGHFELFRRPAWWDAVGAWIQDIARGREAAFIPPDDGAAEGKAQEADVS